MIFFYPLKEKTLYSSLICANRALPPSATLTLVYSCFQKGSAKKALKKAHATTLKGTIGSLTLLLEGALASWFARSSARPSEQSVFEPWPGTLCCVLGKDTLLSQCLSPPRCINGYHKLNAGGNP